MYRSINVIYCTKYSIINKAFLDAKESESLFCAKDPSYLKKIYYIGRRFMMNLNFKQHQSNINLYQVIQKSDG